MSDGFYPGSPLGLNLLAEEDNNIDRFFVSLPEEVRQEINVHAEDIHSEEDLRAFADRLMHKKK